MERVAPEIVVYQVLDQKLGAMLPGVGVYLEELIVDEAKPRRDGLTRRDELKHPFVTVWYEGVSRLYGRNMPGETWSAVEPAQNAPGGSFTHDAESESELSKLHRLRISIYHRKGMMELLEIHRITHQIEQMFRMALDWELNPATGELNGIYFAQFDPQTGELAGDQENPPAGSGWLRGLVAEVGNPQNETTSLDAERGERRRGFFVDIGITHTNVRHDSTVESMTISPYVPPGPPVPLSPKPPVNVSGDIGEER